MITLIVHNNAKKYFKNNREIKVEVKDYYSLVSFLTNSFPSFEKIIRQTKNDLSVDFFILNKDKKRVDLAEIQANKKLSDDTYYIVPSLVGAGGKGGFIQIAIGIALIAAAFYFAPVALGGGANLGATAFQIGSMQISYLNIAMSGASMLLQGIMTIVNTPGSANSSTRTFRDDGSKTENNLFTGLTNTVHSGVPVGLRYGMTRIGGQLISGYIKTTNHGKNDVIKVSESFAA